MPERRVQIGAWAGAGYMKAVGATTRFLRLGWERIDGLERPAIWAFWHNRLLGPLVPHRNQGAGVVISQSRDGELISRVIERFGYVPLRGSTSRGGANALRAVLRHLGRGRDVAFTPDGPRGPRYTVHPGVGYVAVRTGRPVVPVGVGIRRKKVFRSWDRFQLPLPFGTVLLHYGAPLVFDRGEDEAEAAERIRTALNEASEAADAAVGTESP